MIIEKPTEQLAREDLIRQTLEWRVSPSFPSYEVSEHGDVRRCVPGRTSHVTGKLMKPYLRRGYNYFSLMRGGKRWDARGGILVAEAFLGPKPFAGAVVCHKDGIRNRDHRSNLRWDTEVNNWADRYDHGTNVDGTKNPNAKLSLDDVAQIKELWALGRSQSSLGRQFGVSQSSIWGIVTGRKWKCAA